MTVGRVTGVDGRERTGPGAAAILIFRNTRSIASIQERSRLAQRRRAAAKTAWSGIRGGARAEGRATGRFVLPSVGLAGDADRALPRWDGAGEGIGGGRHWDVVAVAEGGDDETENDARGEEASGAEEEPIEVAEKGAADVAVGDHAGIVAVVQVVLDEGEEVGED